MRRPPFIGLTDHYVGCPGSVSRSWSRVRSPRHRRIFTYAPAHHPNRRSSASSILSAALRIGLDIRTIKGYTLVNVQVARTRHA